jgi:hypothetical protein
MVKLRAIKDLKYGTRRLLAGEEFEAPAKDARVLIEVIKKARAVREPARVPPPPPDVAEKIAAVVTPPPAPIVETDAPLRAAELAHARADYREAFGKAPFHTWDAAALREKIAAKNS